MFSLEGKKGLVVGIANENSIAWGCAKAYKEQGAELAVTYLNEKAKPYVEPLAQELNASMFLPCDVQKEGELENVFKEIEEKWGKLDFLHHAIAFAPLQDLHGRVVDCSLEGFQVAMDVSCHSFIRMAKLAEPLMKDGGSLLTTTYYGSQRVVDTYGIMGPVKATLESAVMYMADELGSKNIRVNAVSPGPIATRAASGIKEFNVLLDKAKEKAPLGRLVTQENVGAYAAFLVSDEADAVTGNIAYVDAGYHSVD